MKKTLLLLAVTTVTVACNKGDADFDASGVFEAKEVIVSAKVQGEIRAFDCEEGDAVATGDTLGFIDMTQLNLRKEQLVSSQKANDSRHLNINSQIASVRQQIANAKKEKARFQALLADKACTQKQVDDIQYQIEVLQCQLAALTEQVGSSNNAITQQSESLSSQISSVAEQINDAYITTPISGVVLQKYLEKGEYAVPGKPLFKVADISDMTLRAYITADQYNTLKIGQTVSVTIDGQEKAYQGKVTWISSKAEFTPKTIQTKDERQNLVYAVKIGVKNDGAIKIGMYGDVKF